MDLFDPQGRRLYVTAAERAAFLAAAAKAPRKVRSLCLTLHYTEEKKGSVIDEIHSHVTSTFYAADLAYAPPFSPVLSPIIVAASTLSKKLA
jgi:hypothetical protein